MASFVTLRGILQEAKPDLPRFLVQLEKENVKKEDLNLLLRKAVESKPTQFSEFCSALVRKGASINFFDSKDHISNLMMACEKGTTPMVEALLSYPEVSLLHTDVRQLHAGFYAVENKSREDSQCILRLLLQTEPAMVNQEAGNQTLLIAAIRKGKLELVKLLLEGGADPNWQVPDTGNTSLHDAVKQLKSKMSKAMTQIIRLLLLHGGDSSLKNKQQKTVFDYAEKALPDYRRIEEAVLEQLSLEHQKVVVLETLNDEHQVGALLQRAYMLFEQYEEESEEEEPFQSEADIHAILTEEVLDYERECLAEYEAAQRDLKPFLGRLEKLVQPDGLGVELYGSFATGLWVRQSNIDVQLNRKDPYDNGLSPKDILDKVYEQLRRTSCRGLSLLNRRVSLIRLEVGDPHRSRNVHITVADRSQSGKATVKFIAEQLALYSQLRPTFLVLKSLSCHFRLNEQKNGGIRSYTLFIMLLSCILKWNSCDLGKLLTDFLFYFSFYYELYELRPEEEDCGVVLHILDPLNPSIDLGKYLRAHDLQKMFRAAYIACRSNVGGHSRLKMMFDTRKILIL